MTTKKNALRAGRTETGFVVFVEGRGTMRESRALHDFAMRVVEDRQCSLAVELSACDYLDSTFLGCLVDLFKRFGRNQSTRFQIIADEEKIRHLLATTHLHILLPIAECSPQLIAECLVLPPGTMDRKEMGCHIMECHRRLAEMGGPNQSVFSRIADQIAMELEKGP